MQKGHKNKGKIFKWHCEAINSSQIKEKFLNGVVEPSIPQNTKKKFLNGVVEPSNLFGKLYRSIKSKEVNSNNLEQWGCNFHSNLNKEVFRLLTKLFLFVKCTSRICIMN